MVSNCKFQAKIFSSKLVVFLLSEPLTSNRSIEPAATVVPYDSVAEAPRFDYELVQLTEDVVERIGKEEATAEYADLFAFDDGPILQPGECKTFPGDEGWPADAKWDIFNGLLGNALIPTTPVAAPCCPNWGIDDKEKCNAIITNFADPDLHEPTSNMWPIWQGWTCLPIDSPNGSCTLGGYPSYAVNISNVAQLQLAVNFARNSNLRLVIKNTGHCYLGKSTGAGSLSVWMHNLKNITFLPDYQSFEYSGKALKAAHQHGVSALGGICESVGFAGGYIAGGGHTPLSGLWGMAADHVMALEVVTADGRFVTATNTSNPDLYWALRGGGGSTFGIVTSVIIRVHPQIPITTSVFNFTTSATFIPFTDAGTYSWFWVYRDAGEYQFIMEPFAPNHTVESFKQTLGIPFTPKTTHYNAFYPAYDDNWRSEHIGYWDNMQGNRLFPRGNWMDPAKFNAIFDAIRSYHQAPRNRANVDNAVSSAFRNVISFLITGHPVPGNATPSQMREAQQDLVNNVLGPWREVAPASEFGGSYLNEAYVMEPNWQEDFYGTQYPELLRIKHKWDPKGTFYATTAVGSEDCEVPTSEQGVQTQNGRLCRRRS
ncbi:FAD/FMN-containing isoamyl alcohol oxidase-like protein MreA [Pseudomassariella vexata]|uniref:FAD/FMN-containing isoamyl alcohol oxidase-like protein MreA n=1 Tax=Pseudomassariella vexata TaxID=1141098 RepID=A0A1Y2DQQ8_9PEZI|nr:FAD/FMN-containing isoamyl alcohol oxidase-like protein MreA [Pseudomassariella vexata]ORY61446.1 FAD/FMN-containing isoamyl alcohol oxidase-like protein MreA [Pseudomassariella vexata]